MAKKIISVTAPQHRVSQRALQWCVLRVYALLMWLAQRLLRHKLAKRGVQEPGYNNAVSERFGHYTQPAEATAVLVWVHAVSLGETRAAALLLPALRRQCPGLRLLLTHGTATGRASGAVLLEPGDIQVWQPWDSRAVLERFFTHFKPRLGLLVETEVWPLSVAVARLHGVPLVLVNARLSEKSARQARRLAWLARPAYGALASVLAQTSADAERFQRLGVARVSVLGNIKFDATPNAQQQATGAAWRTALGQRVVMFASSRSGEELEFFKQISALRQPNGALCAINLVAIDGQSPAKICAAPCVKSCVKFLVVPRHPQRFNEVHALAEQFGLSVSRRSDWTAEPALSAAARQADVWLGDSLGDMALYYALSDAALLGGSFAPLGGQNLIEAAASGCPVVMGPHTFNFQDAAELAAASGAAWRVRDLPHGLQTALALVGNAKAHSAAVSACAVFANTHRGATHKTALALTQFLS